MFRREIDLPETLQPETEAPNVYARKIKRKAKRQSHDQLKQKCEDEQLHGQCTKRINGLKQLGSSPKQRALS